MKIRHLTCIYHKWTLLFLMYVSILWILIESKTCCAQSFLFLRFILERSDERFYWQIFHSIDDWIFADTSNFCEARHQMIINYAESWNYFLVIMLKMTEDWKALSNFFMQNINDLQGVKIFEISQKS